MLHLISVMWAVILPPRKSATLVATATPADLLGVYQPITQTGWTALLPYQHPVVQACITEAKFHNNHQAQYLLHTILSHHLTITNQTSSTLTPIPLSAKRKRVRGHNQVESILRADTLLINPIMRLLERTVDTPAQSQLSKSKRLQNMQATQIFVQTQESAATNIIICDDVVTTGATLKAAKRSLARELQAKTTCLALAH